LAKLANILPCITTPEYRDWPSAHYTALKLGAANGYRGQGVSLAHIFAQPEPFLSLKPAKHPTTWDKQCSR
jgi:hypothetical protein